MGRYWFHSDGTDASVEILPYVTQLAKAIETPLALHTVIDIDPSELPPPLSPAQIQDNLLAHANDHLASVARSAREQGVSVSASTSMGKAAEEILRAAKDEACGLIAMATHGRNLVGRALLGSVTDKVLHASQVPVLVITPEKAQEHHGSEGPLLSSVVAPLDGSELAERSLPHVENLAQTLSLGVVLLRVVTGTYPATYPLEELERQALRYLDTVARRLRDRDLKVTTQVLRGTPALAVAEFARFNPQSIIVITSHGRSGITRWLMGSVAEALVRSSGDPVMVIPTRE